MFVYFFFRELLLLHEKDVILGLSPFTFDPSIVDLFLFLSSRCRLILVATAIKQTPIKLAKIINEQGITVMQSTPSLFLQFGSQIAQEFICCPSSKLRAVLLGGEPFPSKKMLNNYIAPGNSTKFYNVYGITEVSCWATIATVDFKVDLAEQLQDVDLGRPLKNTDLRVVNAEGIVVVEGEGKIKSG